MMNGSSQSKLGCQNRIKESCRIESPGQEKKKVMEREKEKHKGEINRGVQLHAYAVL
jgi:hypothetical protein